MAQNHEKESYRFQINVREGAPDKKRQKNGGGYRKGNTYLKK